MLCTGAFAQDTQKDTGLVLDEIVVTARKREENLLVVPIAVTAFSNAVLRDLQIRNPTDLAAFTPGFSFVSALGRDLDRPVIRGMSNIRGEPNASFFIDGVYVPGSIASTELQDLERVEIIKGPQAALFGRATFAGAINYVTKRPGGQHEGRLSVTGANHDEFNGLASLTGPLLDSRLFYYVAASHYEYGGEYTNLIDSSNVGAESTKTITAKLLFTPSAEVAAALRVTLQKDDDDHAAIWLQGADLNNCFDPNMTRPASRGYFCGEVGVSDTVEARTDFLTDPGIERDLVRSALTVDWSLAGGFALQSITGLQDEELDRQSDVSYAAYDPLLYLYGFSFLGDLRGSFWRVQKEKTRTLSQELRISSPDDRALRWTLGAYFLRSKFDQPVNDKINPLVDTPGKLDPSLAVQMPSNFPETLITENIAFFGGLEADFTDRLRATFELRYAEDRKSQDFFPIGGVGTTTYQDATFYSAMPRITLSWLASDDLTVYGNIAKGNKPGGFNDPGAADETFDEEESLNFEVGVKSRWRDARVRWNTTLFFIDWDNQQLTLNAQRPDGSLTSFIENIGKTEVLGLETELDMLITGNWELSATHAYIDSEIRQHVSDQQALFFGCVPPPMRANPDQVSTYIACVNQFGSVAGNESPRSSRHQASLRTIFTRPFSGRGEWFAGANVTYESSRYAQVHNLAETGDTTRVGVQLGIRGDHWEAVLWGKNIFDDDTAQDILRYIDTRAYTNAPFIACPPPPSVFRTGENCGPNFLRALDPNGNTIVPRGFGITLPRGRQIGATVSYRY